MRASGSKGVHRRRHAFLLVALLPVAVYVTASMLDVDGFNRALWPVDDMSFSEALQAETVQLSAFDLAPSDVPLMTLPLPVSLPLELRGARPDALLGRHPQLRPRRHVLHKPALTATPAAVEPA